MVAKSGVEGLATAVQLAGGWGEGTEGDDQEELFAATGPLPLAPVKGRSGDKGGRPAGARNRSTEWWRQRFLTRYESPVMGLGEIYSRATEDLARELMLTRVVAALAPGQVALKILAGVGEEPERYLVWDLMRAFELQVQAMRDAAPYVHARQAPALPVGKGGLQMGVLLIGDMGVGDGQSGDGLALRPYEENQRVIDGVVEKSDAEKSDAG